MTYEVYMQTSSYGSFVLMATTVVLMAILAAAVVYLRKKYFDTGDEDSFSMREFYHDTSRTNPEREYDEFGNDLTVFQAFMPATQYGVCSKYYVSESMRSCHVIPEDYPQQDSCSICLLEFEGEDEVRTTPCRHRYHKQCIDSWCQTNLSCPICRRTLDFSKELRSIYIRYMRGELRM
jgi:hypothetical protein